MVKALGAHLAAAEYAPKLLGVRQNFDAVGTEGTGIPLNLRNNSNWIVRCSMLLRFVPLSLHFYCFISLCFILYFTRLSLHLSGAQRGHCRTTV